ncbi:MAG: hypothetical protein IPJ71_18445 [Bdellovibrionales bacterium]|nr:hypothetical protein [Bdellovibrionales bacterium]
MHKKLLVGCLLGLSTTVVSAEEPAPNQLVQSEISQFAPDKANSIRLRLTDGLTGNLVLSLHRDVTPKLRLGLQGGTFVSDHLLRDYWKYTDSQIDISEYNISAYSIGVGVEYALGESIKEDTWYLSGILSTSKVGVKNRFIEEKATGDVDMLRSSVGYQWVRNRLTWHLAYEATSWYRFALTSVTPDYRHDFGNTPPLALADVMFRPSFIVFGVGYVF